MTIDLPLNSIVCGDNVATMATFHDASIDLVVTSPPYDNLRTYGGHSWDFEGVAQQLWRVIKPGGVVVCVVADATIDGSETGTSFRQALRFKEIGFRLHDTMIWDKAWCQYGDTTTRYANTYEFMFVLAKGSPTTTSIIRDRPNVTAGTSRVSRFDRRVTGDAGGKVTREKPHIVHEMSHRKAIWEVPVDNRNGSKHPAIFPEALARDHIISWSNEGDIVLDPFNGSGTTTKMARAMGRRYIGIEINPEYCEIARKRLAQKLLEFGDVLV